MDPRLVQKTIRIFLSSTFTDTKVDRNELMEEVFEPIRELCRQHGIAFEVVDLRWGKTAILASFLYSAQISLEFFSTIKSFLTRVYAKCWTSYSKQGKYANFH